MSRYLKEGMWGAVWTLGQGLPEQRDWRMQKEKQGGQPGWNGVEGEELRAEKWSGCRDCFPPINEWLLSTP